MQDVISISRSHIRRDCKVFLLRQSMRVQETSLADNKRG
ncbi:hypothetical protein KSS87_005164, partial [Heliosperma pusillum]